MVFAFTKNKFPGRGCLGGRRTGKQMMSVTTFFVIGGAGTRKPLGLEFTRTGNKRTLLGKITMVLGLGSTQFGCSKVMVSL